MSAPHPASITVLHLGEESSTFQRESNGVILLEHRFALGVTSLAAKCFRHSAPHPVEIENGIEVTEDVVMPLVRQFGGDSALTLRGVGASLVAQGLNTSQPTQMTFDVEEVEALFNHLVDVSLGRPISHAHIPVDGCFYSACLMLREVMHHFQFTHLNIQLSV